LLDSKLYYQEDINSSLRYDSPVEMDVLRVAFILLLAFVVTLQSGSTGKIHHRHVMFSFTLLWN